MPDQGSAAAAIPDKGLATSDQIEWLVAEFGPTLYRVAYAIVRDRQVAEDVVQEVLVKAWTSMPEWGGDTPIRWARTVTRNTALSFVRATTARRATLMEDLESVTPPTSTPEDDIVRAESTDAMWRVFSALGEDERIILMLHEVEGLSYEEIALTIDVSGPGGEVQDLPGPASPQIEGGSMRWRRKPTPSQIRSWLENGTPEWVEQWIDHPDVTAELERLTELPPGDADRLAGVFEPAAGFDERTVHGVSERVSDLERIGVLFGLLGLGARTARAVVDPQAIPEDS